MAERTTIELKRDTWKELQARKEPGDSFDDVVNDLIDVPNEFRVTCGECGADGGTYDFTVNHGEPAFCPWCGEEIDAIPSDDEPTALSWRPDRRR